MSTSTRTVRIKRTTGETVGVEVIDAQHYEVDLEGRVPESDPSDQYAIQWRHEIVIARDAREAKQVGRGICVEGEHVSGVRKLDHATVAVLLLHGAQVVA